MSLASRLPYDHPYAGGFSGIGSQSLPTDSDCLTYLSAVAAADGAGVEVGVAMAVNTFFRDTKAAGVFDALKACCILAGARTLAGALVPVVGDAPTNVADGFVSGDYSRTAGLRDPGGTSSLDPNLGLTGLNETDNHAAVYLSTLPSAQNSSAFFTANGAGSLVRVQFFDGDVYWWNMSASNFGPSGILGLGLVASGRNNSSSTVVRRIGGNTASVSKASVTPTAGDLRLFSNDVGLSFYSFGDYVDLETLDTAVTNLITAIGNAL